MVGSDRGKIRRVYYDIRAFFLSRNLHKNIFFLCAFCLLTFPYDYGNIIYVKSTLIIKYMSFLILTKVLFFIVQGGFFMAEKIIKKRYACCILYSEHFGSYDDVEQLVKSWLVPVAVSPLHDPDPDCKKPHYHVMIDFKNAVSEDSLSLFWQANVKEFGTRLFHVTSAKSYYRYLTHKDHPERQQFKTLPLCYCGFEPCDIDIVDIYNIILDRRINSFSALIVTLMSECPYAVSVATSKSFALSLFMREVRKYEI